jgi:flagellar motor switch protein FliN/FliY
LASDLSNIIKEDISSTLESLLSVDVTVNDTLQATSNDLIGKQCICIDVNIDFSHADATQIKFYIPSITAAKFEFLMLGGIGDLKDVIDDEIADAVNEIISNICGSMSTNINAQNFDDIGTMKHTISNTEIIQCEKITSLESTFKFDISLDDEELLIFIEFESSFVPHINVIACNEDEVVDNTSSNYNQQDEVSSNAILSLLGEESIENLKLLFDIKFKLSVRLGTKILLLKDITSWDTGTIIELEQMVNEPLDILANGIKIGEGEAVIIDGKFGVKIKQIGNEKIN